MIIWWLVFQSLGPELILTALETQSHLSLKLRLPEWWGLYNQHLPLLLPRSQEQNKAQFHQSSLQRNDELV